MNYNPPLLKRDGFFFNRFCILRLEIMIFANKYWRQYISTIAAKIAVFRALDENANGQASNCTYGLFFLMFLLIQILTLASDISTDPSTPKSNFSHYLYFKSFLYTFTCCFYSFYSMHSFCFLLPYAPDVERLPKLYNILANDELQVKMG